MNPSPTHSKEVPAWLFVVPWSLESIGGVNEVVKHLIRCFQEGREYSPELLISGGQTEPADATALSSVNTHFLELRPLIAHPRPYRSVLSFLYRLPSRVRCLSKIIKERNVQVINPHFPGLSCVIFLILKKVRRFRGQMVLSFHGSDVREALATSGMERTVWKILLRGVDHIVVVSNDLGRDILTLEPKAAPKLTTIYNGVDRELFAEASNDSRDGFATAEAEKTIISVGAFRAGKGHNVLLRAFSRVVKTIPDAKLLIIGGSGEALPEVRRLIGELSLSDRVSLHVDIPHEQVPRFLTQAIIFALASRREGYPLAVIEAGAARLPVVSTRAPGTRELIKDGVNGRLVDIDDDQALAEAIIDLLANPDKARRLAASLHQYVRDSLTWPRCYEKYLLLARRPARLPL